MNVLKVMVLLVSLSLVNAYATTGNIESPDGSKVYVSGFLMVEYDTIVDAVKSYFDDNTRRRQMPQWEIGHHSEIEFHHRVLKLRESVGLLRGLFLGYQTTGGYERLPESSEAMVYISMIHLMCRRV